MKDRARQAMGTRWVGVCFLVGAASMTAAWFRTREPLLLVSAALQLVAWSCLVHHANRLEAAEDPGGR